MNKVREIALEWSSKELIAGASAYARKIDFKRMREIAVKLSSING